MGGQQPTLETARLVLRPFRASDAAPLRAVIDDPEISRNTLTIPHPYPDGRAETWIAGHLAGWQEGRRAAFAVCLAASGELCGAAGLDIEAAHARAELGYWIARAPGFHLYRRPGPRARLCQVTAPTLVVGDASSRRALVDARLLHAGHDAAGEVLVESEVLHPDDLDGDDLAEFGAVLFADRRADDALLRAWAAARGGELRDDARGGALWSPAGSPPTRVTALDDARLARSMDRCEIDVSGLEGRALVLSELYALFPGWSASVDGVPLRLQRADALVTILRLPEGARRVVLSYRPPGLLAGAWISLAGLLAFGLGLGLTRGRARRDGLLAACEPRTDSSG